MRKIWPILLFGLGYCLNPPVRIIAITPGVVDFQNFNRITVREITSSSEVGIVISTINTTGITVNPGLALCELDNQKLGFATLLSHTKGFIGISISTSTPGTELKLQTSGKVNVQVSGAAAVGDIMVSETNGTGKLMVDNSPVNNNIGRLIAAPENGWAKVILQP